MTVRNFWRVFIKGLGIWVIISSITVGLNYISAVASGPSGEYAWVAILFLLVFSAGIFYLTIRYCIFKTEWLIDRLKLDEGFDEERIDIATSNQTFIALAISVFGGIYFVDALPDLCRALYSFYQQDFVFRQSPGSSAIVYKFVQTVIGFILLTNGLFFARLLIKKASEEEVEPEEEEVKVIE